MPGEPMVRTWTSLARRMASSPMSKRSLGLLALMALANCSLPHDLGNSPPYPQQVCIQWQAQDGYLYQRQATFSYRGECTGECHKHQDTCLRDIQVLQDWRQWMQWMREMCRPGMGGVCSQ